MIPPFRTGLEKGNISISTSIPTLPGRPFKDGCKGLPAVFLEGLSAVFLEGLSAVFFIRRFSCPPSLWRGGGLARLWRV